MLCINFLFHVLSLWQPLDFSWASPWVQAEIIQMAGTGSFGVPASEEIKSLPEFIPGAEREGGAGQEGGVK